MSAKPERQSVRIGDVSGTAIVGDNNHVTTTKHEPDQPQPQLRQQNSAEGHATVFAVEHGVMHVTQNTAAAPEAEGDEG
ncbi:hypothetical protein [Streptacidiphilus fuscans]|uniref:Uncharacterized protein n=1 Tax=Streptacidiphilus fuscans TaxID=2789292 RepID=A0A931B486_9ACTN|nr:hypothetical protein [Streptacidiphilus fuscans]MBF9068397.1 hypothetical protein [Streptacidiphilus fuscans]